MQIFVWTITDQRWIFTYRNYSRYLYHQGTQQITDNVASGVAGAWFQIGSQIWITDVTQAIFDTQWLEHFYCCIADLRVSETNTETHKQNTNTKTSKNKYK